MNWPDPPGPLIKPWELVLCESVRGSVSLLRLPAFAGLGSCTDRPADPRDLSVWLSPDDVARLVQASLTATGWRLVWGISANTRRWWSTAGGQAIGYVPRGDAESWAATVGEPDLAESEHRLVGGTMPTRPLGAALRRLADRRYPRCRGRQALWACESRTG